MKSRTHNAILMGLAGLLLVTAACSKSNSTGSGGGGNPDPNYYPGGYTGATYSLDYYDNSNGNPGYSIRRAPIKNRMFYLNDKDDSSSGYVNNVAFQFDQNGILNASAVIDVAAFSNGSMNGFNPQMSNFMNGQNQPQQQMMAPSGLIQFKGTNISYSFNSDSGRIEIDSFYMSSNVNSQNIIPGQQGRLAIAINGVERKERRLGIIDLQSTRYKRIRGILSNLEYQEPIQKGEQFNPMSVGFDLSREAGGSQIEIASGEILMSQQLSAQNNYGSQFQYGAQFQAGGQFGIQQPQQQMPPNPYPNPYPTQNINMPGMNTNFPMFMFAGGKKRFLYLSPALDPRGFARK